jgi:hypothetical protein
VQVARLVMLAMAGVVVDKTYVMQPLDLVVEVVAVLIFAVRVVVVVALDF